MRYALACLLAMLCGCNGEVRLSAPQAQDAAAAREGARAARVVADRIAEPEIDEATRQRLVAELQEILTGTAAYAFAALENAELPPAVCPPPLASPRQFAAAGIERAKSPAPAAPAVPPWLVTLGATLSWIAGGGAALAAGKFLAPVVPGLRTLWRASADGLWSLLQHRQAKAADEAAQAARAVILAAAPALRALRDAESSVAWNSLPAPARAAAIAIIDAAEKGA